MDTEKPLREIRKLKPTKPNLALACYTMADALSGGKWHLQSRRRVGIDRYVSEETGLPFRHANTDIEPVEQMTRVAFSAHKYAQQHEMGFTYDAGQYDLRLTIGQSVAGEEIPAPVLDDIFDPEYADSIDDDSEDASILDFVTRADLDNLSIMREEEIIYRISERGRILGYDLVHSYSFDDEVVFSNAYLTAEGRSLSVGIDFDGDGVATDARPARTGHLTAAVIEREVRDLDESFARFLAHDSLRRSLELRGQSHRFHAGRALGILSLVASGMIVRR